MREKIELEIEGKKISIFSTENADSPLVILNTYGNEGEEVWNECHKLNCPSFCLAAISNLDWNKDLSPWESPALYKKEESFSGGADAYLLLLAEKILPAICDSMVTKPSYVALAGYSLAGLFSIYSAYRADIFARIASVSGSLWFPGFEEYVKSQEFVKMPDCVYLSLGDTESKAKNKVLSTVQDKTASLFELYKSKNIPVIFELNKGNHFTEPALRTAKGIKWILEQ
jgi:predicted alpha/beta superfamily hydrolase